MTQRKGLSGQLQDKSQINNLILLLTLTYMISYITRIDYGAIVSEMVNALRIPKSRISMALTGSFITYGFGQIISGICGDRFSPKKLISCGLVTTVLMNTLLPFCRNEWMMLAVWCVNGFAQAFMWPPMVRLMSSLLSENDYNKAVVKVSWGSSFGTMAVYLLSPLVISFFGWKAVFYFAALCGGIMILIWICYAYDIAGNKQKKDTLKSGYDNVIFSPLMLCIMLAIVLQGMLRDGVTTWMPSYISETYNISNLVSICSGVLLPIFGIVCFQFAEKLYSRKYTNPMLCGGVIFGAGAASSLGLFLLSGQNAAFSVLFSALLTGCMHGVNLILICMIPPFFKKYGNVSTVSGILNSCTYVGSAISTYGIAVLSERIGWRYTLFIWLMIAAAGTAICLSCVKTWQAKMSGQTSREDQ